jgi:hypothetical protein
MVPNVLDPAFDDARSRERVRPRLLNIRQAADYLGCSFWTARDYILQGLIPVVDMPPLRARQGDASGRRSDEFWSIERISMNSSTHGSEDAADRLERA